MRQSDRAYEFLRSEIIDWRLPPGSLLNETEIADRVGISRTPVREALQRLAGEGLVQSSHRRGAVVSGISIQDVSHLFQLREALETQAARICARRGDSAHFDPIRAELQRSLRELQRDTEVDHRAFYELIDRFDGAIESGTDNPYLAAALRELRAHIRRIRRLARRSHARMESAAAEHLTICDAICAGDETLAAQATAVHIRNSLQSTVTALMEDALATPRRSPEDSLPGAELVHEP